MPSYFFLAEQTRQYGLVAEEVAEVAPQLVIFGSDGAPQSVRYHLVNAMLLNEVQKRRRLDEQQTTIVRQQEQIQTMQEQMQAVVAAGGCGEIRASPGLR